MLNNLVIQFTRAGLIDPQPLEFVPGQPAAEAEHRAPVGHVIEHDDLLGQPHRIVPRHDDHLRAEQHALGAPGNVGQSLQRARAHRIIGEVMLGDPYRIIAELLAQHGIFQFLADELPVRIGIAALMRESCRQPYMHLGLLHRAGCALRASS
jgi:hypothetical protein